MASSAARMAAVIFLVFCGVSADDKCTAGCNGATQPTDGFIQDTMYHYWLDGATSIRLAGASKQETSVRLSARATVMALGNCAHLLKVTELQITGHDGTKYRQPENIKMPVRFTLQDGVLGPIICAEEDDSQKSLNTKRAILSLLQTATKYSTEVDVFGICSTTYAVSQDGANGTIVRKNRDLNTCAQRKEGERDLLSDIYNPSPEMRNTHILQSDMKVDAVLKNGIVEKVEAQEDYLYRPFSAGQAGARAAVTTKLELKGTSKGTFPSKCVVAKSIIFEKLQSVNTDKDSLENVLRLLEALNYVAEAFKDSLPDKASSTFVNLIRVFRMSSRETILMAYKRIKTVGQHEKVDWLNKIFFDALFHAGTADSVEASITLLQQNELTLLQKKKALLSLSRVRHASSESLKVVTSLLDGADIPNELLFGVGTLAGAYCREHPCRPRDAAVAALSAKMASKLGDCKTADSSRRTEDTIISALKGLRNIHHLEDSIVDELAHCAADTSVEQRVRVAALETFTADACIPKLKATALNILKDTQQDSEVRVKAYLALLECPCAEVAGELKYLLDSEPVHQVGSYITSSLRNIRATANPVRESAKQHFSAINISNEFSLDGRKYSQNYEVSFEALGVGSVAQGDVIYSQGSIFPRSVNLNLTAEIFGRQVNLIELGVRQENLDRVLEVLFGPNGLVKSHPLFRDSFYRPSPGSPAQPHQGPQATESEEDFQKLIQAFGDKLKTGIKGNDGQLDFDVFVKLLGTESVFLSLGGEDQPFVTSLLDRIFSFFKGRMPEEENSIFRNHFLFLDTELTYPTSCGMDLKLTLEGAATTNMKLFGFFGTTNASLEVASSANIEISGALSIDADVVVHGLKVVGTLQTATGSQLVFQMLEHEFDLRFELIPPEKQDIFTASSEVFFYKRNKGSFDVNTKVAFDRENWKQYDGCFDQLSDVLSLKFCGTVAVPWHDLSEAASSGPLFPLNGHAKLSVHVITDDIYKFYVLGKETVVNYYRQWKLVLAAEGAHEKKRKVSFFVEHMTNETTTSIKASMNSPHKYLNARITQYHGTKGLTVSAGFKIDDDDYKFTAGIEKLNTTTYKPLLDYTLPGISKSISIDGTINTDGLTHTFDNINLVTNTGNVSLRGFISIARCFETDWKMTFGEHEATFVALVQVIHEALHGHAALHSSLYPSQDLVLNFKYFISSNTKLLDTTLVHGPNSKSEDNKLSLYACINGDLDHYRETWTDFDIHTNFSYPRMAISFDGKTGVHPRQFELDLSGAYRGTKTDFELEVKDTMKKNKELFGKILVKLNDTGFKVESKYHAQTDHKSSFSNILKIYPSGGYELAGIVLHKLDAGDVNLGFDARIKISENADYCGISVGVVYNFDNYHSHMKLSRGSTDYFDALFKVGFKPTLKGSLKVIAKDIVNVEGHFQVDPDHNGDGLFLIDLTKTKRKLKLETKFVITEPQYNITIDIYPNYSKDNAQKITFTTNTTKTEGLFESKSGLTINGDKTEFHILKEETGELKNGKYNILLEVSRPNEKSLSVQWQRKASTNKADLKASMQFDFIYIAEKGAYPIMLLHEGRVINETSGALGEYHMYITTSAGRDLNVVLGVYIEPKNQRKNLDVRMEVTGGICPEKILYTSHIDYFDGKSNEQSDAKYVLKGLYGQKISVDVTGSYSRITPKDADKVFKNDMTINMILPLDVAQDVRLSSVDSFIIPQADDKYIELSTKKSFQVNAATYKYSAALQLAERDGKLRVSALVPERENLIVETSYSSQERKDKTKNFNSTFNVDYGTAKQLHLTVEGTRQKKEGDVTVSVALPNKAKHIVTNVKYKKPGPRSFSSDVSVNVDGKLYALTSEVDLDQKDSYVIDINATFPEVYPARFYIKTQKIGEHQYTGESKLKYLGDLNVDLFVDAKLVASEDFDIDVNVLYSFNKGPTEFKQNEVNLTAKTEAAEGGRQIQFSASKDGEVILSGLSTIQSRQEGDKFTMEGSGNVKVRGEQKSSSFKYMRHVLNKTNENGVEVFFNVVMGEKKIVIDHKAAGKGTNQKYKLSSIFCVEKTQCTHIAIDNKLDTSVPRFSQNLELGFDLKKLGFVPKFMLHSSTELERFKLPIHSLDIHLSQNKSKYHAQVLTKPVNGVYQSTVSLTTPQRIISLESATSVSGSQSESLFPIIHETTFFLNKNDPASKTQLKLVADFQRAESKKISTNGEVFFSSPSLLKDLQIAGKAQYDVNSHTISSELVLDIFKKKTQKVVVTFKLHPELVKSNEVIKSQVSYEIEGHINGKGLGFDILLEEKFFLRARQVKLSSVAALTLDRQRKAASLLLDVNTINQTFLLSAPREEILRVESACSSVAGRSRVDMTIHAHGENAYLASGEISLSSPYSVSLIAGSKENSVTVMFSSKSVAMQMVEVTAVHFDGNQTLPLASFSLDAQNDHLMPAFNVNKKQIKQVVKKVRAELTELVTKEEEFLKQQIEQTTENFQKLQQTFQSASFDFSGLPRSLYQQLQIISEELKSDKVLQQLTNTVGKIFISVSKVAIEITEKPAEIFKRSTAAFSDFLDKLQQVWIYKLLPNLTSLLEKATDLAVEVLDVVVNMSSQGMIYVVEFVEKNSIDLKPVLESVIESFQEFYSTFESNLRKSMELTQNLYKSITELSFVRSLMDKIKEYDILKSTERIVEAILHHSHKLRSTDELKAFFSALDKTSNTKKFNDLEEWRVIFSKFVSSFAGLATYFNGAVGAIIPNLTSFITLPSFRELIGLSLPWPPKFSIFNYLQEEAKFSPHQIIKSFWPKSLNPLEILPPDKLRGLVVGGQHFFTFDGRLVTFPGNCRYVLAQDAIDGNFSIIMNLENGIAKSVTLWDKSKNIVEVNDHTQLTLNAQKSEFQAKKASLVAWKDGHTFIIHSQYGAFVKCSHNLDLCYVELSGFYLGKLRGLLGDGNGEPFDDFRLPNGQISMFDYDFVNAYALSPDCRQVMTVDHSDYDKEADEGICSKLFGKKSVLSVLDVFVSIKNFRQACQHAAMGGGPKANEDAYLIAKAYTLACHGSGILVPLPAEGATYQQGQVTKSQKQADILIIGETIKKGEGSEKK